jgi:phage baseplate assembly protein W|tara:strand:- start:1271 stop:1672 length:402 start_codon:yes stop_codon:yes gene_type:complete
VSVIKNVVYKDVDLLFDKHPVTRKINTLTNNAAISRALKTLVLTDKGERPYQPFLGGNIRSRLFDLASNGLQIESDIQADIEDVIREYEPRAELIDVFVNSNIDANSIDVTIKFRAVNQTDPEVVSFFLTRVR